MGGPRERQLVAPAQSRGHFVLFCLLSVVLSLAGIELLARAVSLLGIAELASPPSPREAWHDKGFRVDRYLKFANRRNSRHEIGGVAVQTNSLGLRGREPAVPKPAGSYRILALGDSTVFGFGVAAASTFSNLLEQKLNRRLASPRVEVINAGVPGYSLFNTWSYLQREGIALEPDLLIVETNFNDRRAVLSAEARDGELAHAIFYYRMRLREALSHSYAYRAALALSAPGIQVDQDESTPGARQQVSLEGLEARVEPARYRALLGDLLDFAQERGIEVILVPHRDNPQHTLEFDWASELTAQQAVEEALKQLRASFERSELYRFASARRINEILEAQGRASERLDTVSLPAEWMAWDGNAPVYVSEPYDAIMLANAKRDGVAVVGLAERALVEPTVYLDQIHLNALGHRELAARLARAILLLPDQGFRLLPPDTEPRD